MDPFGIIFDLLFFGIIKLNEDLKYDCNIPNVLLPTAPMSHMTYLNIVLLREGTNTAPVVNALIVKVETVEKTIIILPKNNNTI